MPPPIPAFMAANAGAHLHGSDIFSARGGHRSTAPVSTPLE